MPQYGFHFDSSRCTGCKTCQIACRDYWDTEASLCYRRVYDYEGGSWTQNDNGSWNQDAFIYHVSISCNHCTRPACVRVCPTGAMHKEDRFGLVRVDTGRCIGCGYCMMSCPYGAPYVSKDTKHSTKCDGCYNRVKSGDRPICVEACPLRALDFGAIEMLRQNPDTLNSVAPLPDASYTFPNLTIRPCPATRESGSDDGFIANFHEVQRLSDPYATRGEKWTEHE